MKTPRNRTIYILIIAALLIYSIARNFSSFDTGAAGQVQPPQSIAISGLLKVHFIDVGQADSILVQAPEGSVMLIDAGNNSDGPQVVKYIKDLGISRIDILIGTHPHEDHIGGMDTVINSFAVGSLYLPEALSTTITFSGVLNSAKNKKLSVNIAKAGVQLELGGGARALMLAPNSNKYEELNNWSAAVKIVFGSSSFLLMGDAEVLSEKEMLAKGYDLKADLLKLGHHGSNSSTGTDFLSAVNCKYAVISTGIGNDYGHPHKSTMLKLKERSISVYRTDQNKTIIASSDGKSISFNSGPGNYDYAGEK